MNSIILNQIKLDRENEAKAAGKDNMRSRLSKQLQVRFKAKKKIMKYEAIQKLREELHPYWKEIRFLEAVNSNNTEEVKKLLQQGVSPNSTDFEMRSALHIAVSRGYVKVVELLLDHGADPNKRDMIQNTPLHLAACVHNFAIISMLINAKADVSCLDLHGRNPLQLASSKLQLLQKGWRDGTIEMINLREELQQVVDLLLSIKIKTMHDEMGKMNQSDDDLQRMKLDLLLSIKIKTMQDERRKMHQSDVDDLQMMKLSINSGSSEDVDDQMSKLLEGIKNL